MYSEYLGGFSGKKKRFQDCESRESDDRENEVHQYRETCGSDHCVDFRIRGIPHSTVEQVETNRKEKVRRLLEQFESHPNWNMLLKDYKKSEEINHFSRESKDLITEMGNNEIFKFCETSSKRQCPDCALYWEIGIGCCTCGKCMRSSDNRQLNNDRFDSLSIPRYVIKKNQSRGPRDGQSMRQTMYHKARDMFRKAKLVNNGSCETILERWFTDAVYQKSLSEGWTEEKIRQYDALALEDHSYKATPAERGRWQRNWKIVLNKWREQVPIRQQPDCNVTTGWSYLRDNLVTSSLWCACQPLS